MKAAIAIRNASDVDIRSKDALIDQMQKDLNDSKALYFREVRHRPLTAAARQLSVFACERSQSNTCAMPMFNVIATLATSHVFKLVSRFQKQEKHKLQGKLHELQKNLVQDATKEKLRSLGSNLKIFS